MKCIAPNEIKDGYLLACLENAAPQHVRDHLARCQACAAQAASLTQVDRALKTRLFRVSCPLADTLLDYVIGTLPPGEQRQVASHIESCSHCAADVLELKQASATPESDLWGQVIHLARAIVEAVAVPPRVELVPALRGAPQRLRLFHAGDLDIALDSEISGEELVFRLRGRVMERGAPALQVVGRAARLVQEDTVIARQQVDDLGYFIFEDIPPGKYDLMLDQTDADIVIRHISLESPEKGKGISEQHDV